jgi:putative transposase
MVRYALYLYFSSRSLRLASRCLSPVTKRSHVAIWKWVQKYAHCADRFRTDRRAFREIFVDETPLQIAGQDCWLWVAYEPNLNVCLSMYLSRERTLFVCYHFFSQLRRRYGRKRILTDGARWYNEACRWLRLPHQVYGTERKNVMERFIQHIKDRTECFDDHFPCRKEGCDRRHVWNWLRLFVLYYHMDIDRRRFMLFLSREGG